MLIINKMADIKSITLNKSPVNINKLLTKRLAPKKKGYLNRQTYRKYC